jgi:hypothetical protein
MRLSPILVYTQSNILQQATLDYSCFSNRNVGLKIMLCMGLGEGGGPYTYTPPPPSFYITAPGSGEMCKIDEI